jgi:hypothetical protein
MTNTRHTESAAADGKMEAPQHTDLGAAPHRAQAELIEMLARLLLAAVDADSSIRHSESMDGTTDERRSRRHRE